MGILEYLFGPKDTEAETDDDAQPAPSTEGRGPDIDTGRRTTKTERDLRKVQSQYDPEHDRFDPEK